MPKLVKGKKLGEIHEAKKVMSFGDWLLIGFIALVILGAISQ